MAAKMSVLGLILSSYPYYLKSAMVRFPLKYLAQVKEAYSAREELFKQKGRGQTDIRQTLHQISLRKIF